MKHSHLCTAFALVAGLAALPVSAQRLDDAARLGVGAATVTATAATAGTSATSATVDPTSQPSGVAAPALARAGSTLVTKEVLRDLASSANRDWKTHTMGREYKEDFDCPMSFAFAGELHANGYKGLKLFGTTVPVNKPADSGH